MMHYIIYKITNLINGRYYIGRHATKNIDDGYMGSGTAIRNAINKYGIESFSKEIIACAFSADDLWELEKQIINLDIVQDKKSYNMAYGGKHYLHGLKYYDHDSYVKHQSNAGKIGGPASYYKHKTKLERQDWHRAGGKASAEKQKLLGIHPFYDGTAAVAGGKALKGFVELWKPDSVATNKNQKEYKTGDCARVKIDSDKYKKLVSEGWLTTAVHKQKARIII